MKEEEAKNMNCRIWEREKGEWKMLEIKPL